MRRPPWTLQRRLILTIVGIVSVILVMVALTTSAMLGRVLEEQLDKQLQDHGKRTITSFARNPDPTETAAQMLDKRHSPPGTLLAVQTLSDFTGAYITDSGQIVAMSQDQLTELAEGFSPSEQLTLTISDAGSYRLEAVRIGTSVVVVGMSRTVLTQTIGQMLTLITLITGAGLILLVVATAWTIRAGLGPLRAVADTATRVANQPLAEGAVSISERVPLDQVDPHTEVGRVGEALNTLLEHVDASLHARQRNEERMRRFVADASHELRTPLAAVRGYSELSLRDPALGETSRQALERIQAQSVRMTRLVEDLLLLARLEEGTELVTGTVDLSRLAVDALADARVSGPDHAWVLEVPENAVEILGDASRLHQVAANLLANARVHTPAGTTVTLSVQRTNDGGALLSVHDDGPGIPEALQEELFQRFARGDVSRARKTGGTGLGLSIARAITEAHGGTLSVTSRPGSTIFSLRIPPGPLARPAERATGATPEEGNQAQVQERAIHPGTR